LQLDIWFDKFCFVCQGNFETSLHLFLHCNVNAAEVWNGIFQWLGVVIIFQPNPCSLFNRLNREASNKKVRKRLRLIWHTTLWLLCKPSNNFVFNNKITKAASWRWSLGKLNLVLCLYYEWCWDPHDCFSRWKVCLF
jgi:hypothetical protein